MNTPKASYATTNLKLVSEKKLAMWKPIVLRPRDCPK